MRPTSLWLLALTAPILAQQPVPDPAAECRELVLPSEDELAFDRIGWRTSLAVAALEADAADRPVLLWAMNGHPLGCT